jgi:hypothetical protein
MDINIKSQRARANIYFSFVSAAWRIPREIGRDGAWKIPATGVCCFDLFRPQETAKM